MLFYFPVLSIDPVIGAISAGNAVVLKPSEIAPATSSLLSKLVEEYLDSSVVKVIEGAIPETSALLEQKWDKILYTGQVYNYLAKFYKSVDFEWVFSYINNTTYGGRHVMIFDICGAHRILIFQRIVNFSRQF